MKKLTFTIATFVCILSLFIYSCRKEKEITPKETSKEVKGPNLSSSSNFSDTNIVVSPYGFLIFRTQAAFENFCLFATSTSHAAVQDYFNDLGFNSQGSSL